MKLITLATGSSGNCYLLEENNKYIVLDCGIKFEEITSNKNFPSFRDIDLVISTHCHQDHCKSLKDFKKTGVDIISYETLERKVQDFNFENWTLKTFPVVHNVDCWGVIIKSKATGKKLCYVTDFSAMPKIFGIDYWLYEVNYLEYIVEKIADKNFDALKFGFKNHNSLEKAEEYFEFLQEKPKAIICCHLSQAHSNEKMIKKALKKYCDNIHIAKKDKVVVMED